MAESHSVKQQKTEGEVNDVLALHICSGGDPDTSPCTPPLQNEDFDVILKLKGEEKEDDTTHDEEPTKVKLRAVVQLRNYDNTQPSQRM